MSRLLAFVLLVGLAEVGTAAAQTMPIDSGSRQTEISSQDEGLREVGRTGNTGTGEIGQRQTQKESAPNIEPLGRINNRIQNRLQNRLRNRIDRNYDPKANATAPFQRAEDQVRKARNSGPRR